MNKNCNCSQNLIHCDVCNCEYNNDCKCMADKINVGPTFATSSSDTVCATFKPGK